jgi:hypothetical protein
MRRVSRATGLIGERFLPRKREKLVWIKGVWAAVMWWQIPADSAPPPPSSAKALRAQLRYLPHPGGGAKGPETQS